MLCSKRRCCEQGWMGSPSEGVFPHFLLFLTFEHDAHFFRHFERPLNEKISKNQKRILGFILKQKPRVFQQFWPFAKIENCFQPLSREFRNTTWRWQLSHSKNGGTGIGAFVNFWKISHFGEVLPGGFTTRRCVSECQTHQIFAIPQISHWKIVKQNK